jgi:uncharacterized protein YfaS (alpha-2-macroglobulin family)
MDGMEIDPASIEQGKDFIVEVSFENPGTRGSLTELALTQMFPSGWEIINSRMQEGPATVHTSVPVYQDIRDDRVLTYFNLPSNYSGRKVFRIQLNATYIGRFYLPAVVTEAMYDNSINARIPGRWVTVTKPD